MNNAIQFKIKVLMCTDQMKQMKAEVENLAQSRHAAEQAASAAAVKMDVLANYFKEKEQDLNR